MSFIFFHKIIADIRKISENKLLLLLFYVLDSVNINTEQTFERISQKNKVKKQILNRTINHEACHSAEVMLFAVDFIFPYFYISSSISPNL